MTLASRSRACGAPAVCAVCVSARGFLPSRPPNDAPGTQLAGVFPGATKTSSDDICVCHTTGPCLPLLTLRIDWVVLAVHADVAGQLRAMNSFHEKMSTALCDSPSNGQASSGSVAWAAVMLAGQDE